MPEAAKLFHTTPDRLHLYPVLGNVRLDAIREREIQRVKLHLEGNGAKTVACVLSVLATLLRTAERWDIIDKAPRIEGPRWGNAPRVNQRQVRPTCESTRRLRFCRAEFQSGSDPSI